MSARVPEEDVVAFYERRELKVAEMKVLQTIRAVVNVRREISERRRVAAMKGCYSIIAVFPRELGTRSFPGYVTKLYRIWSTSLLTRVQKFSTI